MKRSRILTGLCLCLALLTGCAGISTDELYCLPEASADYYNLQEVLGGVLDSGCSFFAPESGSHQEAVQMADLNGDGRDEAVAFLKNDSDNTIRLAVFTSDGTRYTDTCETTCDGISINTVEYADLFGDGGQEILLRCQVSEKVTQALQVYRFKDGEISLLAAVSSDDYVLTDLDGDSTEDLISISGVGSDTVCLRWLSTEEDGLDGNNTADCAAGTALAAMAAGMLSDHIPAVLVTGQEEDGSCVTEAFCAEDGTLKKITADLGALVSSQLPQDTDGDGFTELPLDAELPAFDEGSTAQDVTGWYRMDSNGKTELTETIYQNNVGGWSFVMPESWQDQVSVRVSSETGTTGQIGLTLFSRTDTKDEIMTIYTLQGSERQEYAEENGLTILYTDSGLVVAVRLAEDDSWDGSVTLAEISERFVAPETEETENTDTDVQSD